ncbi:hypothetical protein TB1_008364 [Malus domestica]
MTVHHLLSLLPSDPKEELPLSPGFRFHPTDEELIICYLMNKINDATFTTGRAIADVDLNKCEPWELHLHLHLHLHLSLLEMFRYRHLHPRRHVPKEPQQPPLLLHHKHRNQFWFWVLQFFQGTRPQQSQPHCIVQRRPLS